jgi:hypothetical protein
MMFSKGHINNWQQDDPYGEADMLSGKIRKCSRSQEMPETG